MLDPALNKFKLDSLLCSPKLLYQSNEQLVFLALSLKHSHLSN